MNAIEFKEKIASAKAAEEDKKELRDMLHEKAALEAFDKFSERVGRDSSVGNFKDFITNKMIELFAECEYNFISLTYINIECDKCPRIQTNQSVMVRSGSFFRKAVYKTEVVDLGYPRIDISGLSQDVLDGFVIWARTTLMVDIVIAGMSYISPIMNFTSTRDHTINGRML